MKRFGSSTSKLVLMVLIALMVALVPASTAYARDPGPQRSRLRCTTRIHGPCEATFDGGKEAPKPARLYRDSDNR